MLKSVGVMKLHLAAQNCHGLLGYNNADNEDIAEKKYQDNIKKINVSFQQTLTDHLLYLGHFGKQNIRQLLCMPFRGLWVLRTCM